MSAPTKMVEVLCPTGRRQKVKTDPSMTVLQILQQVCEKQGYIDAEYDLKYQRKILNVTSMMRYLNLANNAKLELVKCEKPRIVSKVTLAIQMEDGKRFQEDFEPDTTLLDVITRFRSDIEQFADKDLEPVVLYMRNEYRGSVLSRSTLKTIGITSGRAALRVIFRPKEPEAPQPSPGAQPKPLQQQQETQQQQQQQQQPQQQQVQNSSLRNPSEEPNGKKMKMGGHPDSSSSSSSFSYPTSDVDMAPVEGNAYASLSIIGAPPRQIFPDEFTGVKSSEIMAMPQAPVEPVKYEFADFKFPDAPAHPLDDLAIDPKLMKQEVKMGMSCERKAVVFSMKREATSVGDQGYEPDDSFFQVTIDDLRKRMSSLKSERKAIEDGEELLTSRLRELKKIQRASNFDMIPVRISLPGQLMVQGIFRPLETVGAIREFLQEYLLPAIKSYELFVTPPKVILKDRKQTLYDAKLFPAALVHVSFGNTPEPHMKQEYLDNLKTCQDAEDIVDNILKRKKQKLGNGSRGTGGEAWDDTSLQSSSSGLPDEISSSSSSNPSSSSSSSFNSRNTQAKGAPKWLKTGR